MRKAKTGTKIVVSVDRRRPSVTITRTTPQTFSSSTFPAETDPWGRLRVKVIYARRRLAHYERATLLDPTFTGPLRPYRDAAPELEAMRQALQPAFAAIDTHDAAKAKGKGPTVPLSNEDAHYINEALATFEELCAQVQMREVAASSGTRAVREEGGRKRTLGAERANAKRKRESLEHGAKLNAEAAKIRASRADVPEPQINGILARKHGLSGRHIRRLRKAARDAAQK